MGPDGKELIPQESPKVNGYGFVATPSPAPGKNFYCCWVFGGGGFLFFYFFSPRVLFVQHWSVVFGLDEEARLYVPHVLVTCVPCVPV